MRKITRKEKSAINRRAHELSLRYYNLACNELTARFLEDESSDDIESVLDREQDAMITEHCLENH